MLIMWLVSFARICAVCDCVSIAAAAPPVADASAGCCDGASPKVSSVAVYAGGAQRPMVMVSVPFGEVVEVDVRAT